MSKFNHRNQSNDGADYLGRKIEVGQTVVKASSVGRSAVFETRKVTAIRGDKIYLDESKVAINFSGRLLIIYDRP